MRFQDMEKLAEALEKRAEALRKNDTERTDEEKEVKEKLNMDPKAGIDSDSVNHD